MRAHGTPLKWNDDRGFGFVALPQSHEEIFVHISAFPRDGVRPRIGETASFEVRTGPSCDGRTHCSQMTSCAEAEFFLKHCAGVKMDGNGDGEPCEQQWCN